MGTAAEPVPKVSAGSESRWKHDSSLRCLEAPPPPFLLHLGQNLSAGDSGPSLLHLLCSAVERAELHPFESPPAPALPRLLAPSHGQEVVSHDVPLGLKTLPDLEKGQKGGKLLKRY